MERRLCAMRKPFRASCDPVRFQSGYRRRSEPVAEVRRKRKRIPDMRKPGREHLCPPILHMIQRIQSAFLFMAALSSGATWLFPVRSWSQGDPEVRFLTTGLETADGAAVQDIGLPIPYAVLHSVVALVMLAAIFLYANRKRQARLVRGGWMVALLTGVLQFISCNSIDAYLGTGAQGQYGASFFLPAAVILFGNLAERAIRKDEELVRSADRLR